MEAFIASLSSTNPPSTSSPLPSTRPLARSREDPGRGLEKEARDILRLTNRHLDPKAHNPGDEDDKGEDEYEDLETEDEIIERAIDESHNGINVTTEDGGSRPQSPDESCPITSKPNDDPPEIKSKQDQSDSRTNSPGGLSFPSLPTHAPVDVTDTNEEDQEMDARMARLLGLSGPSTLPGPSTKLPSPPKEIKREAGQGWNIPGYNDDKDDDPDSWCCESPFSGIERIQMLM